MPSVAHAWQPSHLHTGSSCTTRACSLLSLLGLRLSVCLPPLLHVICAPLVWCTPTSAPHPIERLCASVRPALPAPLPTPTKTATGPVQTPLPSVAKGP